MRRYYPSIKKFSWIVLVCVVLSAIGGYALAKAQPQAYVVTSTLFVDAAAPGTTFPGNSASATDSITQANEYAGEIPTRAIMSYVYQSDPSIKQHGFIADDLLVDVTATVPVPTASNILLTASTPTAADAVLLANDVARGYQAYKTAELQQHLQDNRAYLQGQYDSYKKQSDALETQILNYAKGNSNDPHIALLDVDRQQILTEQNGIQTQLQQLPATITSDVFILSLAKPTDVLPSAKPLILIGAATGVGLLLGLLLLLLMVFIDDRLRGDDQVTTKLGMTALGGLSTDPEIKAGTIPNTGLVAQQLADIGANLRLTNSLPGPWRAPQGAVLLVTSTQAVEGKTTTAVGLAASVARGGRSVLVIDGDLRKPATHLAFGMSPTTFGLSGLLKATGAENIDAAVQRSNMPGVWLLPGGTSMDDGTLLLEQKLPAILAQLSKKTDMVIIDGPALLSGADASLMTTMVDGVVLVVDSRHDKLKILLRARDILRSVTQKPVGVVINHLSRKRRNPYYAAAYTAEATADKHVAVQKYASNGNGHEVANGQKVEPVGSASMNNPANSAFSVSPSPGRSVSPSPVKPMDFPLMQPNPNPPSPFPAPRRMDMTPPQS